MMTNLRVEELELLRWPVTMALLGVFSLFCLLLFIGAIVHRFVVVVVEVVVVVVLLLFIGAIVHRFVVVVVEVVVVVFYSSSSSEPLFTGQD